MSDKVKVCDYSINFWDAYQKEKRKVIIYGVGNGYAMYKNVMPAPDMLCDKNAESICTVNGIQVHNPVEILDYDEPLYIIITVIDDGVFNAICGYLGELGVDALVFHVSNNIGFKCDSFWGTQITYVVDKAKIEKRMRIHLVCNEDSWILRKFAIRMSDCLAKTDIDYSISDQSRDDVDLNHHIQFATFKAHFNDTLMISHVDCGRLLAHLKTQLRTARLGICMSRETMETLVKWGVEREKLCYINPAHDGIIKPRKITVGITHKTHEFDLRKRISALFEMIDSVDPKLFRFVVMGAGWKNIIRKLNELGFETEYYPDFDMETYISIVPTFDYYLFMGFDEGSMGYLDAVAAGVKTIVTPQGFHLDNNFPIDYPCRTVGDFRHAFEHIQDEVLKRTKSVSDWTWENYTKKHIAIWEYILRRKPLSELYGDQLKYEDGIYSVLMQDNRIPISLDNR